MMSFFESESVPQSNAYIPLQHDSRIWCKYGADRTEALNWRSSEERSLRS